MNLRGLVLIGFSGLCLTAAAMFNQSYERSSFAAGLAQATTPIRDCMREGITTSAGRVGCFTPVSAEIGGAAFNTKRYTGGNALSRR